MNFIKLVPVLVAIVKALADGKLSKEELLDILAKIATIFEPESK